MKFNSIKFEISFLYTLILGITLSIFSIVLYLILFSTVYHELDYDLKLKAEEITLSIRATILLLSSFVGWLLTDRLLKPGQQITDTAQKISLEDLSSRVKEEEYALIDNALKFTDGGGRLEMAVTRESQSVIIAISDTGKGISETNLMKIFEKFFREDYQEFGVGLGLSVAKSIVKIHAGQIHVASKVNQGTTFTVALPLLE